MALTPVVVGAFFVVPLIAATTVDDFANSTGSDIDLVNWTPTPGGVGDWTLFEDTTGGASKPIVSNASDYVTPIGGLANTALLYQIDWTPASAE